MSFAIYCPPYQNNDKPSVGDNWTNPYDFCQNYLQHNNKLQRNRQELSDSSKITDKISQLCRAEYFVFLRDFRKSYGIIFDKKRDLTNEALLHESAVTIMGGFYSKVLQKIEYIEPIVPKNDQWSSRNARARKIYN